MPNAKPIPNPRRPKIDSVTRFSEDDLYLMYDVFVHSQESMGNRVLGLAQAIEAKKDELGRLELEHARLVNEEARIQKMIDYLEDAGYGHEDDEG